MVILGYCGGGKGISRFLRFVNFQPRKLAQAHCLADLKAQDWDLDELEKDVIDQITRRLFELNC